MHPGTQEGGRGDGILFFGSVQRGGSSRHSDLDLYVITDQNECWHEGRLVAGVEVELAFGPARFFQERMESGNAVVIHAFASGTVLLDRTGEVAALVERGQALWAAGPRPLTPAEVQVWRYRLSDGIRDLADLPTDSPSARMLAGMLVPTALEAYHALHGLWPVPPKQRFEVVRRHDPALGEQVERFYHGGMAANLAIAIADAVLRPFGGRIQEYKTEPAPC